jgi:dihydrofolate synthase/folylpolyglutamate synthase
MSGTARDLEAWLEWQSQLHPKTIDLGLERVAMVWSRLGPKPPPFPVITVGGTNGKGSCVAMLEAIYRAAGYRTAAYTSPHLIRYNERVRLDGEPVTDDALCAAFARVEQARDGAPLTYFEYGTLAALDLFVRARPEIAILEVGLGGRLDAVNLLDAEVAVVTSIGLDHTAWLGETLDEIAAEKAGIFRPGRPAVIGQADAPPRLRAMAEQCGSRPLQIGREIQLELAAAGWVWRGPSGESLALPDPALRGAFQYANAAAAIAAVAALRERLPVAAAAVRAGIQSACLLGRFQVIRGTPTWILDVAHNREAAQALASNLRAFACPGRVRAVLAVLADKVPEAIVQPLLHWVSDWYLTQSDDPRAMPAEVLLGRLQALLPAGTGHPFGQVRAALQAAAADSAPGDAVLVVGSFTTVGEALRGPLPGSDAP